MAHAWMDSLSEDWVSQPGSDASDGQLPPLPSLDEANSPQIQGFPSSIPRKAGLRSSAPPTSDDSPKILSERSANDINISLRRLPSKLSQEIKIEAAAGALRSVSNATNGSVVHNSIPSQRSPSKEGETPEWKRRLIYGEIPYGEQRDLFCSAAVGLQDMFRPPQEDDEGSNKSDNGSQQLDMTLPSSPPTYPEPVTAADFDDFPDFEEEDEEGADFPAHVTPSPSPRRSQKEFNRIVNESSPISHTRHANQSQSGPCPDYEVEGDIYRDESCLSVPEKSKFASRKPSGQSDTHNEDFSPILIGKHSGENGNIKFAPIEVPVEKLWQKLERLRVNQLLLDSQADLQADFDASPRAPIEIETTEDYIQHGGFINAQRGGRSGDGSFYHRGLSSDIGADTSEMLPEESLQASTPKQFPSVRTLGAFPLPMSQLSNSPSLPKAPFPSPDKKLLPTNLAQVPASSPLKLFGPYDTFTNQTLLRRISQFEQKSGSPSQRSTISRSNDHQEKNTVTPIQERRAISTFGHGDLNGFEFGSEISDDVEEDADFIGKENVAPHDASLPVYPLQQFRGRGPLPKGYAGLVVERKRSKVEINSPEGGQRSAVGSPASTRTPGPANGAPSNSGTPKRDPGSESKRPRASPYKDSTPKRRRTLHRSDIAFGRERHLDSADTSPAKTQTPLSGKKRKDVLPGSFEVADPSILAIRPFRRPHSTASSRCSSESYGLPNNAAIRDVPDRDKMLSRDTPPETDRKPSIRTQDFVDQAAQIMAMIRNQVRPELASLEESEEYDETTDRRQSIVGSPESTTEPLSRPPSREGKAASWEPPRQDDPELLNRLKKYQEFSDVGDIISSSMRSTGLAKVPNGLQVAEELGEQGGQLNLTQSDRAPIPVLGEVISDLPNVKITSNHFPNKGQDRDSREYPSSSSTRSTSRNYPSASSRGSEFRRTIMPESVSHLIPDRVGGMCLDKEKNVWLKRKESTSLPQRNVLPSEDSEDDPFASIPDLSVDMTKEMQNLRLATGAKECTADGSEEQDLPRSPSSRESGRGFVTLSPNQHGDVRADALMTAEISKLETSPARQGTNEPGDIVQNRNTQSTRGKRRNLTISFSSPIASVIRDLSLDDLESMEDEAQRKEGLNDAVLSPSQTSTKSLSRRGPGSRNGVQTPRGHADQVRSRQGSDHEPIFIPRPVSRIDEQDEESTVELETDDRQVSIIGEQSMVSHKTPDGRGTTLSLILNRTPGQGVLALAGDESAIIGRNVGKLSLSPLSEFTLNNPDQSFGLEVSYVMGHRHMATGDGSKKVLSMTIRELVDRLGEAEPHEPFWEDITDLDLHDKRLASLHMLEEFCGKLVTLDVSRNRLNHLDGVPSTIRELKVSHNLLTEMTSWDHLNNLQYVDISGNEVASLSALKNLVHLRSIKADNNQLTSLNGLDSHDGLLCLRARNNMIEEVDFAASCFERLEELDLGGNQINSIQNLELLPELSKLKLSKNRLTELPTASSMKSLRHLDVSDNELTTLDISAFPNLHSVHADRNYIHRVYGFGQTRRLDSLSLREQRGDIVLDLGFLSNAYEVRKLFLSGNYIQEFDPQVDFLNLQFLELANCGLQRLPQNIGQLMPNLRTLNINLNALRDVSPLQFIPRMKKLLIAGNRLADSTVVTQLLIDFPHLTQLDVRDNPVTQGFYAPLQMLVPAKSCEYSDPFVLPDADVPRDEGFASRLDEATRLRRRLHQIVLVASCSRLRKLDGLPVHRRTVLAPDRFLQILINDGLVPNLEQSALEKEIEPAEDANVDVDADEVETTADELVRAQLQEEAEMAWQQNTTLKSSRWGIEDSFA